MAFGGAVCAGVDVLDGIMACWAMTDGRIHMAADDQSRGWRTPAMVEKADSGS